MKKKNLMLFLALGIVLSTEAFGANGLPFYDKLQFGITIVKVIGGAIAIISFISALYMKSSGRNEGLKTAIWFCLAGILTMNVEWLAEKMGFLQGALF